MVSALNKDPASQEHRGLTTPAPKASSDSLWPVGGTQRLLAGMKTLRTMLVETVRNQVRNAHMDKVS